MIGRVISPKISFTLEDDGSVTSRDPDIQELFTRRFQNYLMTYGPADGPMGVRFLNDTARSLGGKAQIQKRPPAPKGIVY